MLIQRIIELAQPYAKETVFAQLLLSAAEAMNDVVRHVQAQRTLMYNLDNNLTDATFQPAFAVQIDAKFASANRILFVVGCALAALLKEKNVKSEYLNF